MPRKAIQGDSRPRRRCARPMASPPRSRPSPRPSCWPTRAIPATSTSCCGASSCSRPRRPRARPATRRATASLDWPRPPAASCAASPPDVGADMSRAGPALRGRRARRSSGAAAEASEAEPRPDIHRAAPFEQLNPLAEDEGLVQRLRRAGQRAPRDRRRASARARARPVGPRGARRGVPHLPHDQGHGRASSGFQRDRGAVPRDREPSRRPAQGQGRVRRRGVRRRVRRGRHDARRSWPCAPARRRHRRCRATAEPRRRRRPRRREDAQATADAEAAGTSGRRLPRPPATVTPESIVRVDEERLDQLLDAIGEFVIAEAMTSEAARAERGGVERARGAVRPARQDHARAPGDGDVAAHGAAALDVPRHGAPRARPRAQGRQAHRVRDRGRRHRARQGDGRPAHRPAHPPAAQRGRPRHRGRRRRARPPARPRSAGSTCAPITRAGRRASRSRTTAAASTPEAILAKARSQGLVGADDNPDRARDPRSHLPARLLDGRQGHRRLRPRRRHGRRQGRGREPPRHRRDPQQPGRGHRASCFGCR